METKIVRKLILDTETTGLDFDKDRIIEVACLELIDNVYTGNKFHRYFSPGNITISQQSEEIHGLSNYFLKDFKKFDDDIQDFLDFIDQSTLVIHNAQFDLNMINHALKRTGKKQIPIERSECTLELSKKKFPGSKNNLNALCRRFGISLEEREKHSAITDCFLLLQVFYELHGGKQENLKFTNSDKKEDDYNDHKYENCQFLGVSLSKEETENHKKMLDQLPKNFW